MTTDPLAPAARWGSIFVAWLIAVIAAVCIGLFSPQAEYAAWLGLALGGTTVLTLAIQLATQEKTGFVFRLSTSVVGVLLVLAAAALVLWLIGLTGQTG